MSNGKTLKEQMGYVRAENKSQNDKLDTIIRNHDKHERESSIYREQQATNTESIRTINEDKIPMLIKVMFGLVGLAGSAFLLIIGSLIKNIFFTK